MKWNTEGMNIVHWNLEFLDFWFIDFMLLCSVINLHGKVTFVFHFNSLKGRPAQKPDADMIMNLGIIKGYVGSSLKFNEEMQAKMCKIYSIRTAYWAPGQYCTRLFISHWRPEVGYPYMLAGLMIWVHCCPLKSCELFPLLGNCEHLPPFLIIILESNH